MQSRWTITSGENPFHPPLRFQCINREENIWSVRTTQGYRAIGFLEGDTVTSFWIGSHDDYERFFSQHVRAGLTPAAPDRAIGAHTGRRWWATLSVMEASLARPARRPSSTVEPLTAYPPINCLLCPHQAVGLDPASLR